MHFAVVELFVRIHHFNVPTATNFRINRVPDIRENFFSAQEHVPDLSFSHENSLFRPQTLEIPLKSYYYEATRDSHVNKYGLNSCQTFLHEAAESGTKTSHAACHPCVRARNQESAKILRKILREVDP